MLAAAYYHFVNRLLKNSFIGYISPVKNKKRPAWAQQLKIPMSKQKGKQKGPFRL